MHEKISDVTVLTIIISTVLLVFLGSIILYFLFAYQKKGHRHQEEIILLNEQFQKTLLLSKLEIQEQTLDHIAKELHANISQLVSIININLSVHLQQHPSEANENIIETKALVKQLMAEIKSLSVVLNTEHIGKAGFLQMLKNELDRLTKTRLFQIEFSIDGQVLRLHPEKEIILFRLLQEILNNIIKHAAADRITVELHYEEFNLSIRVSDNGKGLDVVKIRSNAASSNSTGISNIYNRSKQIDATVDIASSPQTGTTFYVRVPL